MWSWKRSSHTLSDQDRISPYTIKQTSDVNKKKYKWGDDWLDQHQIAGTKIYGR